MSASSFGDILITPRLVLLICDEFLKSKGQRTLNFLNYEKYKMSKKFLYTVKKKNP